MLTGANSTSILFQNYILIFVVSLCISSCGKEDLTSVQNATVVANDLQSYFSLFEEEGKARGLTINLAAANISGELVEISQTNVAGQCSVNTDTGRRVVRIDEDYWANATALEREFVIFHELGHCFLDRTHIDTKDVQGNCESMMHSGISGCQFQYTLASRTAYLDELFE